MTDSRSVAVEARERAQALLLSSGIPTIEEAAHLARDVVALADGNKTLRAELARCGDDAREAIRDALLLKEQAENDNRRLHQALTALEPLLSIRLDGSEDMAEHADALAGLERAREIVARALRGEE